MKASPAARFVTIGKRGQTTSEEINLTPPDNDPPRVHCRPGEYHTEELQGEEIEAMLFDPQGSNHPRPLPSHEIALRMQWLLLKFLDANRIPNPGCQQIEALAIHLYGIAQGVVRVECAWCGEIMREGVDPVSHGICDPCKETLIGSLRKL